MAYLLSLRCALSDGQTLVMLGSFANVKRFFRFMGEYRVNGFGMVPASWALLKKLSRDEISKYRDQLHYIEIGSAPMPLEEKKNLMKFLPDTRICMHYGLTEASRSAFIEFHEEAEHLTTVGRQSPNMHITIRDEKGIEVPVGKEGEICVCGDAVDDCVCVGIPDPDGISGEVVKAFIVTSEMEKVTFEDIDGWIGNQLEGYKHPVVYEKIKEIPKTSSGKIQRLMLK